MGRVRVVMPVMDMVIWHGHWFVEDMRAPTVDHIRSPNQKLGAIDPRAPVSDEPSLTVTVTVSWQ